MLLNCLGNIRIESSFHVGMANVFTLRCFDLSSNACTDLTGLLVEMTGNAFEQCFPYMHAWGFV